jgi:hypothetical protein
LEDENVEFINDIYELENIIEALRFNKWAQTTKSIL